MHSSKDRASRSCTLRAMLRAFLFLALCVCITMLLNYALIPPSSVRINLHNLRNGQQYDTIFIGTSHGQYGIDPAAVDQATGASSVSLCMADAYPDDMYYLLKLACETQSPSQVVYELDPSYWMNEQRNGSTQIFFYQDFPVSKAKSSYFMDKITGLDFRSALAPWSYYRNLYAQIPENIRKKQSAAYKDYDPSILDIPVGHYGGRGFIYRDRVPGEDKGTYNNIPWDETMVKEKAARYFGRIARYCRENGIRLTVITTPVPQDTLNQFGQSYLQSHEYFTKLMNGWGLAYYNFNYLKPELMDRSMEGYWDYDGHMDGIKAGEFSTLLGQFLTDLESGNMDEGTYFLYQ